MTDTAGACLAGRPSAGSDGQAPPTHSFYMCRTAA
jgi:hypothetical protein